MQVTEVVALRRQLGRVGAWIPFFTVPVADEIRAVRRLDELGYGSIWTGETVGGKEAFAHAGALLGHTDQIVVGTGIANLWARQPNTMEAGATILAEAWPGRFILGVGVSHANFVEQTGQVYEKPLTRMTEYLAEMNAESARTRYPVSRAPLVLAALRPRMLALAREQADGAHPYLVPPSHTPLAREILGPDKLLIPEQAVVLSSDPAVARRIARQHMAPYLERPNYINNLRWLGYADDDIIAGGSDRLVDAIVAWGDEQAIRARVDELHASGADHVLLQPLGDGLDDHVRQLELLAPALI
jgi:probable F420-dependent oxidoreductase